MRALESRAQLIAGSSAPVLIQGEAGSGKQTLAKHLHRLRGTGGRLIRLNPDFPVSAGAGLKASANGSRVIEMLVNEPGATVLLKDIHRLSMSSQEWLLATLDELKTFPLLISTTVEPAEGLMKPGRFLPELFRRLSAYRIELPPLRRRRRDIPDLFRRILAEMKAASGTREGMPRAAIAKGLMSYSWPGNVRELQNVARYYLLNPHSGATISEIAKRLSQAPAYLEARRTATAIIQKERLERGPQPRRVEYPGGPLLHAISK